MKRGIEYDWKKSIHLFCDVKNKIFLEIIIEVEKLKEKNILFIC